MEEDEMIMDVEELQRWIGVQVGKAELISPAVLEKYNELYHLLEKRQKQAIQMLQLSQSLTACENIVKDLYAGLGWDYEDLDSNEGNKPPSNGHTLPSSVCSENLSSQSPEGQTAELPKTQKISDDQKVPLLLKNNAVVVLRRMRRSQLVRFIKGQNPPVRQNGERDWDVHMLSESEEDFRDEDFQITKYSTRKKRKIHDQNQKRKEGTDKKNRTDRTDKTGTSRPTGRTQGRTSRDLQNISSSRISCKTDAESKAAKEPRRQLETARKAAAPQSKTPLRSKLTTLLSEPEKTTTSPASVEKTLKGGEEETEKQAANASTPVGNNAGVSTKSQASEGTTVPAEELLEELTPKMRVLARKTRLQWKPGEIIEIVTKDDGRVKYKIKFDNKGRSLVSGHHIAFESRANINQLAVGTRVVVHRGEEYLPGILGEIPSRKNRMRFLVFTDDGAAVYVGLPLLHTVCRPLKDPLDDIQDENHQSFMKQYLKDWPFPPQSKYKVGQIIKAEHQGTQQDCQVVLTDSSLLKVVFQKDQHTEMIYRGSLRLESIRRLRSWILSKRDSEEK